MSTRYVVTACCAAAVVLGYPDHQSLTARVLCMRCRREVGSPGVEDSVEVSRFLDWHAWSSPWPPVPVWAGPERNEP